MTDDEYSQAYADAVAEGRVKPPTAGNAAPGPRMPGQPPESSYRENRQIWKYGCILVPLAFIAVLALVAASGWFDANLNYYLVKLGLF